jgi:hypothetical protein
LEAPQGSDGSLLEKRKNVAAKRCIPTDLFYHRKFVQLRNDTNRLILIGLIIDADDAGRGLADPDLLGRKLDHPSESIQQALEDLEHAGFIETYAHDEEKYYSLCLWCVWQKLSKPTPSHYPAPPSVTIFQRNPGEPRGTQEKPKAPEDSRPEEEGEEKRREPEDEGEATHRGECQPTRKSSGRKVVPFPGTLPSADGNGDGKARNSSEAETRALVQQAARILRLPPDDVLTRLVVEYAAIPGLSLPGEADAAREWIDDPQRNKKRRRMSPAFFRNWLKREQDAIERRQIALQQAQLSTGTSGPTPPSRDAPPAGRRPPDLMHLVYEDHAERTKGEKH